jgi:hypothetical protein
MENQFQLAKATSHKSEYLEIWLYPEWQKDENNSGSLHENDGILKRNVKTTHTALWRLDHTYGHNGTSRDIINRTKTIEFSWSKGPWHSNIRNSVRLLTLTHHAGRGGAVHLVAARPQFCQQHINSTNASCSGKRNRCCCCCCCCSLRRPCRSDFIAVVLPRGTVGVLSQPIIHKVKLFPSNVVPI